MTVACEGFTKLNGSAYRITDDAYSWSDARTQCARYPGGYLATFETAAESTALVAAFPLPASLWTGVEQRVQGSTGVGGGWNNRKGDARTAIPSGFPWKSGEPNDGNGFYYEDGDEDYAKVGADGKFDDASGAEQNRGLCECAAPAA